VGSATAANGVVIAFREIEVRDPEVFAQGRSLANALLANMRMGHFRHI